MSGVETGVELIYLVAAVCFVLGLHLMNSPATARRGNQLSAAGMIAAIAATLVLIIHAGTVKPVGWVVLIVGAAIGAVAGLIAARRVAMTAIPQLVSLFNAVGGGAAAIVAIYDFVTLASGDGTRIAGERFLIATVLDVIIGAVTFAGSLIAAGKLQGTISSSPIVFAGVRILNVLLTIVMLGGGLWLIVAPPSSSGAAIGLLCAVLAGRVARAEAVARQRGERRAHPLLAVGGGRLAEPVP
jgi:NAD/NADP transhydrogenase beta subunit